MLKASNGVLFQGTPLGGPGPVAVTNLVGDSHSLSGKITYHSMELTGNYFVF